MLIDPVITIRKAMKDWYGVHPIIFIVATDPHGVSKLLTQIIVVDIPEQNMQNNIQSISRG